jgi:hypothetical protein
MRRTAGKNPYRTSCVRFWITLFWAITVFDASEALAQSDAVRAPLSLELNPPNPPPEQSLMLSRFKR